MEGSTLGHWNTSSSSQQVIKKHFHSHLYSAIEGGTCKGVGVFWIKCHLHHVVRMPFKNLSTRPTFIPIPKLYKQVIRWRQYIWKCWMDSHTSNVVCMCFKNCNLIHSIVIVYTDKHVISSSNHPLLTSYKFCWPDCKQMP